jgi:glycosyltransferase involved in cell wall biosynthesis
MKIRGGVDIRLAESVRTHSTRYDGVFVGRFHEQKNIIELLTIWRMVLRTIPSVRLGLVGAGPLERELKTFVANAGMTKNIFFLGVRDGQDKYGILKSSKVFLSASLTDSGNIALDEALSCGVPGIVFNLSRLDYPAGVVKIPIGNKDKFVHAILRLLRNPAERSRLGREGRSFIRRYDWSATSRDTYALLRGIKKEIH